MSDFERKTWFNHPSGGTPTDADGMNDFEARVETGISAAVAGEGDGVLITASAKPTLRALESHLATELDFCAPEIAPFYSFSFTAKAPTVELEVEIGATVAGIAHAIFALFVGPDGTTLVPGSQDSWVLAAGVVGKDLGGINGQPISKWRNPALDPSPNLPSAPGFIKRRIKLTGLTVGSVYDGQITCGIVGNAQAVACGAHAGAVAISKSESPMGHLTALVRNNNDVTVSVVSIGHQAQTPHDERLIDLALPGASGDSGDVALTDSAGQGVVVNQIDGSITVLDLTTSVVPAILDARQVVPGSTPNPIGVRIIGTNAYISCFSTDKVEVYDLVGRAFASTISLTGGSNPVRGRHTPDNAYLLVVCNGSGKLAKIKLSDGTVTYSGVIGTTNKQPSDVAITPDGLTAWVVTRGDDKAYPVTVSSLAIGTPVSLGGAYHPIKCAITNDGRALLVASDTGSAGKQITHINLVATGGPVVYTHFGNSIDATDTGFPAGGLALAPDGAIYITQRDATLLNCYFSARAHIRPGSDVGTSFHGERCVVRVTGADA